MREEAIALVDKNKDVLFTILKDDFSEIIDNLSASLRDVFHTPDIAISYRLRTKIIGFKEHLKEEYKKWKKDKV